MKPWMLWKLHRLPHKTSLHILINQGLNVSLRHPLSRLVNLRVEEDRQLQANRLRNRNRKVGQHREPDEQKNQLNLCAHPRAIVHRPERRQKLTLIYIKAETLIYLMYKTVCSNASLNVCELKSRSEYPDFIELVI